MNLTVLSYCDSCSVFHCQLLSFTAIRYNQKYRKAFIDGELHFVLTYALSDASTTTVALLNNVQNVPVRNVLDQQ